MIRYTGLPTATARAYRAGTPDAHALAPERHVSGGPGNPCRHCLKPVPEGAGMLILAHRPFGALQPYAECGPIFLCAEACEAHDPAGFPAVLTLSPDYLIKGYTIEERIAYGTGAVVPLDRLEAEIAARLADPGIAFVDIRSARNNCWLARARRGGDRPAGQRSKTSASR